MKRLLISFLIVSILVSPAIAQTLEHSPQMRVAIAQGLTEVDRLMNIGEKDKAWSLINKLLREDPQNTEINLKIAKLAFSLGKTNQGLLALERLATLHPENAELRLELAKAYANAGDKAASLSEMEAVRALKPELVTEATEDELTRRAKLGKTKNDQLQIAGRVAAGFLWDSNVNGGIDSLNVRVGSMPLLMDRSAQETPASGEYLNTQINGAYRADETSPWWIVGDVNLFGKKHNRDTPSNETFTWGRAGVGVRYLDDKDLLDIRLKYENANFDPTDHMHAGGGDVTWVHVFENNWQLITRGGIDFRSYDRQNGQGGTYWHGGAYGRYLFSALAGTNSVLFGARLLGADAKQSYYSFTGVETTVRLNLLPFPKLEVAPFVSFRHLDYENAATRLSEIMGESDRQDDTFMGGLTFTYHFNDQLAAEVGYQYLKNSSKSDFYDYDRHQFNTGIVYSF